MTTTAGKIKAYEEALQKVLDDHEVGCIPKSHIDHIARLLKPKPRVIWVNEYIEHKDVLAYLTENEALNTEVPAYGDPTREAIPYIELTPEIAKFAGVEL